MEDCVLTRRLNEDCSFELRLVPIDGKIWLRWDIGSELSHFSRLSFVVMLRELKSLIKCHKMSTFSFTFKSGYKFTRDQKSFGFIKECGQSQECFIVIYNELVHNHAKHLLEFIQSSIVDLEPSILRAKIVSSGKKSFKKQKT